MYIYIYIYIYTHIYIHIYIDIYIRPMHIKGHRYGLTEEIECNYQGKLYGCHSVECEEVIKKADLSPSNKCVL
jgi:hypothetical protein